MCVRRNDFHATHHLSKRVFKSHGACLCILGTIKRRVRRGKRRQHRGGGGDPPPKRQEPGRGGMKKGAGQALFPREMPAVSFIGALCRVYIGFGLSFYTFSCGGVKPSKATCGAGHCFSWIIVLVL